jgi:hypothetical protein
MVCSTIHRLISSRAFFDVVRKEDSSFVNNCLRSAIILFVLSTLAGCASSSGIQHASPIMTGTPVSVDFALVETSSALTSLEPEKSLLKELIISGLRGRNVFGDVDGNGPAAGTSSGIKIKVVIKEIKKISRDERDWAGAMAGRARIVVEATVSDLSSGKRIEFFEVVGESSGGSNLAGTTDEAIERAAGLVVAQVIEISRQTGS